MVQALGSLHSVTKVKYSSPIFFTSNRPAPVPTSSSRSSSVRLAIRAPHALRGGGQKKRCYFTGYLAMRLLSVFLTRRMAVMLAFIKEQSSRMMRGSLMERLMRGWVTSLFTMTPFSTHESSMMPPGT
ncbi:hypothetical protein EYF80_032401 [Liparis tanakae]|uniref:Uncharacterized protein n=1 Tax=Liparis tanakae TaxID=230148 RepID=A0A4Z2GW53_9TELE|nr:hypothetical protein EYF80_032401 [Liparis tanakae]